MVVVVLVMMGLAALVAVYSIVTVRPGQRKIYYRIFGPNAGRPMVLEPGMHIMNPLQWAAFGQGPFKGLVRTFYSACPAPLSTVNIDPDQVEIMSADNVPGTANVSVELQVLDWSASEIVSINVPFVSRASIVINQWVSNVLRRLNADQLCNYAEVVSCLNAPDRIKVLNDDLKHCFLEVKRVSVDPRGIQLHNSYMDTVGVVIAKSRKLTLQRLDAEAELQRTEQAVRRELLELEAKCERDKLAAEAQRSVEKSRADGFASRAKALIEAGIPPVQVATLLSSEVSAGALARAEKVIVGLNPALIGMQPMVNHSGLHDSYEKV